MYTLDRFARNRYDSAIYKAKLKRNGVKIFYAKQPMPDTPEGIILESVLEGYAEYYSENLARSIKRGMKENALHGIAMGSPVLGYKIGNDRQYEIDPVGAKAVRTIFTMYAEGKSKTQIVNWLNEHGFKTSRGNAFNKNSLSRILRNDKYIGVYRYDDVVLEDAVPPIIDKTLFDKVQATFRHNYTARAKAKAIEDYLLTTKVFCGHCGEPMVGESGTSKTGKVHHYYKCVNRKRKHNCEKKVEKKEWLERTVVEFTVQQVLTDENIEKISTRAMELIEKELQDTSILIGLQERLKETNKRIKNLMSAIEQGIITPTTKERLEELEEERRDLEGQIAREEMKKPLLTKERIMYWLESFKRGDIEDVEYQRRIIDTLVNSVYVYDDGDKGRKLVLTFNISGNNTLTISSSDIERTAPADVSELLTRLGTVGKKEINKVYDPACGSGSLLLKAEKVLGRDAVRNGFYGQEINITTYNLCRINMFLHDIEFDKFDIACEDTLTNPQHWDDEPFELIVSNPPYSIKWAGDENPLLINDPRFSPAGVLAPKSKADLAFIMHSLAWLASNGTAAIVCFPGIMYRGGAEQKIRKYLVDNSFIDCIIQLPSNLFFGTSIATCIMVLKKGKTDNKVLFIDASSECIKVTNNNKLTPDNINKIVDTFAQRKEDAHFSHLAEYAEVKENDYNLSVSTYVVPKDTREKIDIVKLNAEIAQIVARENELRAAIDRIVAEIEG